MGYLEDEARRDLPAWAWFMAMDPKRLARRVVRHEHRRGREVSPREVLARVMRIRLGHRRFLRRLRAIADAATSAASAVERFGRAVRAMDGG